MEPTDGALVEQCLEGQREAFAELVQRHQDSVFHVVLRLMRNWADAEDVTQEAFVRAYRKLRLYRREQSFRNWVMAIGVNLAKNRFRSSARRRRAEESHVELTELAAHAGRPRHDEALDRALDAVDDKLRLPVVLKHAEGLSYEEIGGVLGIGVSAAKMRVKRGLAALVAAMRDSREQKR